MQIQSNVNTANKVHDCIQYEPIERQLFNYLLVVFPDMKYKIQDRELFFYTETLEIHPIVKSGKIILSVSNNRNHWNDADYYKHFQIKEKQFTVKAGIDFTKRWQEIISYLKNIDEFEKKYVNIKYKKNEDAIRKLLNNHWGNKDFECSFWTEKSNTQVGFSVHLKNDAPADGVDYTVTNNGLVMNSGRGYDNLLWHTSEVRNCKDEMEKLKISMEIISFMKEREKAFDLNNFPALKALLNVQDEIKNLVKEYKIETRY